MVDEQHLLRRIGAECRPQPKAHVLAGVVDRVNRDLSSSEQVKRFAVIPDELTILAGELTPTLKLRRDAVAARYRGAIEECYS